MLKTFASRYNEVMTLGDERVEQWFLMSSPWPSVVVCILYVILVFWGKRFMAHRPALDLRYPLILYNAALVLLSGWLLFEFLMAGWLTGYSLGCQPVDRSRSPQAMRMARVCWWFYFSKFIELFDTAFFIARKKFQLVTFLHVFHHAIMPASWWFGVKFVPGGFGTFHAMLNSGIHLFMYIYYGLSACGPAFQKYVWWKQHMTRAQMIQFALVVVHSCQLFLIDCDYPIIFAWWILSYAVIFLGLFANFYIQAYLKSRHIKQEKKDVKSK